MQIIDIFTIQVFEELENRNQNTISTSNKNQSSSVNIEYQAVSDYITEYWFAKHPFHATLNVMLAQLYQKTKQYNGDKVQEYYKQALTIARDSLGAYNIYVANLCEEIGSFYLTNENYFEGTKHLLMAYKVYKEHKEEFFDCYIKNLKNISKYYIILGYYKDAIEYGNELITAFMAYWKTNRQVNINIHAFLLNMIKIAKNLNNFEKGIDFCKVLMYDLRHMKPDLDDFEIPKYKDWRNGKKKTSEDNTEIVKLKPVFKLYLKLIIRNLKDNERAIFTQCLIKLIENKKEKESLETNYTNDVEQLFVQTFNQIKEEGELNRYFLRILNIIGAKNDPLKAFQKNSETNNPEFDKSYQESWSKFKALYKIFKDTKVFLSLVQNDYLK